MHINTFAIFSFLFVKISKTFGTNLGRWQIAKMRTMTIEILVNRRSRLFVSSSVFWLLSDCPPIHRLKHIPLSLNKRKIYLISSLRISYILSEVFHDSLNMKSFLWILLVTDVWLWWCHYRKDCLTPIRYMLLSVMLYLMLKIMVQLHRLNSWLEDQQVAPLT